MDILAPTYGSHCDYICANCDWLKFGTVIILLSGSSLHSFQFSMANTRASNKIKSLSSSEHDGDDILVLADSLKGDSKKIVQVLLAKMQLMEDNFNNLLKSRDESVGILENEVGCLKLKLQALEDKIDEADQYERRDTLILSGNAIPVGKDGENSGMVIKELLREQLNYDLPLNGINTAHRLGKLRAGSKDDRPIIVKFCRRDDKNELMKLRRNLRKKTPSLFINESLSATRRANLFALRAIKRQHLKLRGPNNVIGCDTWNGNVHAYTSTVDGRPKKHVLNTRVALEQFALNYAKKPLESFLINWK